MPVLHLSAEKIYTLALFSQTALSVALRHIPAGSKRRIFSNLVGLTIFCVFCQEQIIFPLFCAVISFLLMPWGPLPVFVASFSTIGMARAAWMTGISEFMPTTNICLLLLSLRTVQFVRGLDVNQLIERHEMQQSSAGLAAAAEKNEDEGSTTDQSTVADDGVAESGQAQSPATPPLNKLSNPIRGTAWTKSSYWNMTVLKKFLDYICFFPCLWSGPLLSTETVERALQATAFESSFVRFAVCRVTQALFHVAAYAFLPSFMPHVGNDYVVKSSFLYSQVPALWRFPMLLCRHTWERGRYVTAWVLAEIACVGAGVAELDSSESRDQQQQQQQKVKVKQVQGQTDEGSSQVKPKFAKDSCSNVETTFSQLLPWGNTVAVAKLPFGGDWDYAATCKVDHERVCNIDVWAVEFSDTLSGTVKAWNIKVQTWLVANVYQPLKGKPRWLRRLVTVGVSAFWHGLKPSYYATFLLLPFAQTAQEVLNKLINELFAFSTPKEANRSSMVDKRRSSHLDKVISSLKKIPSFVTPFLVRVLLSHLLMEYVALPILEDDMRRAWICWRTLGFYGFWIIAAAFLLDGFSSKVLKQRVKSD